MAFDFPNTPSSGDVVTIGLKQWTFLTGKWLATGISGGGGGADALNDLTDVTITAVSNGQVLKYNGSAWVNAADNAGTTISSIDDITDVTITSVATGQFLKWNGTAWVNDTIDLGTDTSGSFIASLVAGTGVTLTNNSGEAATPTVAVDTTVIAPLASPTFTGTVSGISATMVGLGNVSNTSDANKPVSTAQQNALDLKSNLASPTFTGTVTTNDLTVSGNLTVSGTTTSINTETLTIDDNVIVLNNNATGAPSQDAGIEVERGSSTNVQLRWNETTDKWEATNDGTTYGNIVTTADSGTVTSAMIVDGTVINADINTSAAIALSKLASGTSAQVVIANSSGVPTYTTLSGDVTISDTGVASIAANSVALGTDTTGNYVSDVTASTGITVTHTPGEGSSATVALNATLDDLSNVSVATPSSGQFLKWNGTAWVPDTIVGGASISDTAPAAPSAGQLWFDSTVGKTFVYYDSQWIEVGGIGTGARMVSSSSAPASPLEGSMWFDTDTAQTFVYYDSSWIEIGASGVTASVQDSAPASPVSGQIWFNSLTGGTYVYYGTNWIEVGASPFSALINTINAKGDLLVGTADNTIGGLTAGSNNQVLTVDSTTATGLKWSTPTEYATTGKAIAMAIVFGG